jgi:hypothetical protein
MNIHAWKVMHLWLKCNVYNIMDFVENSLDKFTKICSLKYHSFVLICLRSQITYIRFPHDWHWMASLNKVALFPLHCRLDIFKLQHLKWEINVLCTKYVMNWYVEKSSSKYFTVNNSATEDDNVHKIHCVLWCTILTIVFTWIIFARHVHNKLYAHGIW